MTDRERVLLPEQEYEAAPVAASSAPSDLKAGATGGNSGPEAEPGGTRVSRAVYTSEQVINRFEENWGALDLKQEIAALGHGLNSLLRRSRSLREFTAMTVALWKLALELSFPDDATGFFRDFMEKSPILGKGSQRAKLTERVQIYIDLMTPKKASDFTPVADYLAEYFSGDTENRKALKLKISLAIRRIYQAGFDHLI